MLDLNLPSFLWLWKIAAWSMGLALATYGVLFFSGLGILSTRINRQARPAWLRKFHIISGIVLCSLVLLLLAIGLIGTIGYYGSLGHSPHLIAGLTVVVLVLLSGWSATQISLQKSWARLLHVGINLTLLVGFIFVSLTGWQVVQKYLP